MSPVSTTCGKYTKKTQPRKNFFSRKYDVRTPFKKKPTRYTKRRIRRNRRYNMNTKLYRKHGNQISQDLNQATDQDKEISPILSEVTEPEILSIVQKITQRLINYYYPNPESMSNVLYPCGLINRSNYCYVNATIQALLACPLVYNLFFDIATCFETDDEIGPETPSTISKMALLVYAFHCNAKDNIEQNDFATPFEANWMYDILHDNASSFQGEQQDAEEFFSCLINKLNDEMVDLVKKARNGIAETATQTENVLTPITDIFGGLLKFNTYRQNEETSSNIQSFFTLPLDLQNSSTIFESFKALTAITKLEGIVCSKTKKDIEAAQQTLIENLPKVLVCQVKCFEYDLDGPKKLHKQLEFPFNLEIDSEMLAPNCENQQRRYKLFAVVYHKGRSITRGHYIAKTYNEVARSWIQYNDENANLISEEQVLKPEEVLTPYLLFYQSCGENNDV